MIKMGSIIHESAFDNDVREILNDEAYGYYDGDTANYRDDSYNGERVGWMSQEYQTRLRSKNRSKNKAAKASRKRNR